MKKPRTKTPPAETRVWLSLNESEAVSVSVIAWHGNGNKLENNIEQIIRGRAIAFGVSELARNQLIKIEVKKKTLQAS